MRAIRLLVTLRSVIIAIKVTPIRTRRQIIVATILTVITAVIRSIEQP